MGRTASGQGQSGRPRAPSQLSIRKDSPAVRNDASLPNTPRGGTAPSASFGSTPRPAASRGPSGGTPVQASGPGSAAGSLRLRTGMRPPSPRMQSGRQRFSSLNDTNPSTPVTQAAAELASPVPASPSSDGSSDESSSPAQSRVIRRPPRFQQPPQTLDRDGAEAFLSDMDEEAQPAFLPYQSKPPSEDGGSEGSSTQYSDPSATLRGDPRDFAANAARRLQNVTGGDRSQGKGKGKERERVLQRSGTSDSSGGSAPKRQTGDRRHPSNPLSPRRTAELKGKGLSREGSDGTPSMGSSFSDLDGRSICFLLVRVGLDIINLDKHPSWL